MGEMLEEFISNPLCVRDLLVLIVLKNTSKIFTLSVIFLMSITVSRAEVMFGNPVFFKEKKKCFLAHIREHLKTFYDLFRVMKAYYVKANLAMQFYHFLSL